MLLVVAKSSGSSPGRAGYKMAVSADGELRGSIGGGVMEVNLVEQSRQILSVRSAVAGGAFFVDRVHRKNAPNASGMICSGHQTVILKRLSAADKTAIDQAIAGFSQKSGDLLTITSSKFQIEVANAESQNFHFESSGNSEFIYEEALGYANHLYIIGGGHCALALSELVSKLDFHVTIFDDRTDLNTIEKNTFADSISIIEDYRNIGEKIPDWDNTYVVVMTIGYASDKIVVKGLADREFKYFGVLGSKAKIATLMKELREEGIPNEHLARIRTPIGIPINSRTPEEIAVSIAAEIIAVKNSE